MKQFLAARMWYIVALAVIAVAGIAVWYVFSNTEPELGSYTVSRSTIAEALDEPVTVVAEKKADLSFQEAGKISQVFVKEGDVVNTGAKLAVLDSASFGTNVAQAQAALAAAQAKLDGLQTGATSQSIAVSQAALASAQQSLANGYSGIFNTLTDAYTKANDAVTNQLTGFFSQPQGNVPQLTFSVNNSQVLSNVENALPPANSELSTWQNELAGITGNIKQSTLDAGLQNALNHLSIIQNLMSLAVTAVADEAGLQPSVLASYKVSAAAGLSEVNAAITEVSNAQQAINSENAALAQAQAQLNLTTASSTPQEIQQQEAAVAQAQAAVDSAQVALDNASLVAPFPGTVQGLSAQIGQVVSPGEPVLSFLNNTGLKLQTYVSEIDVVKIDGGDTVEVTLDAFGTATAFPATITTIDSAETTINGAPSYLVTLHFTDAEPLIKDGMTGNAHLILAEDNNVLAVPSRLLLNDGNHYFVLVKTSAGIVRKPVQIGLVGDNGMTEISSGINEGDTLADF